MGSIVGAISTVFRADTQHFHRGLDSVKKGINKMDGYMRKMTPSIGAVGAAFGAAAVAGVGLLVRNSLQSADTLAQVSENLGIASEKLAAYQFAAKQANVESGAFNNALMIMTRNIAKIDSEADPLAKSLKAVGIDFRELQKDPDKFKVLVGAMSNIKDESQRTALATMAFGKSALTLNSIFAGGIPLLQSAEETTRKFNTALTKSDLAAFKDMDKKFDEIDEMMKGFGYTLTKNILPALDTLITKFSGVSASGEGLAAISLIALAINSTVWLIVKGMELFMTIVSALAVVIYGVLTIIVGIAETIANIIRAVTGMGGDVNWDFTNNMAGITSFAAGEAVSSGSQLFGGTPGTGDNEESINLQKQQLAVSKRMEKKLEPPGIK